MHDKPSHWTSDYVLWISPKLQLELMNYEESNSKVNKLAFLLNKLCRTRDNFYFEMSLFVNWFRGKCNHLLRPMFKLEIHFFLWHLLLFKRACLGKAWIISFVFQIMHIPICKEIERALPWHFQKFLPAAKSVFARKWHLHQEICPLIIQNFWSLSLFCYYFHKVFSHSNHFFSNLIQCWWMNI